MMLRFDQEQAEGAVRVANGQTSNQNDTATYSNSQSFNNSCENGGNHNSLNGQIGGTITGIDEKRTKKR